MKKYEPMKADFKLVSDFLNSESLDNDIILLMELFISKRENFRYLMTEYLRLSNIGFNCIDNENNNSWSAIENVLCLFSETKINDDMYFYGTWKSFSILIPSFDNFYRHSIAIQNAYLRFEKIFAIKRKEFLNNDSWFTQITNHEWWIKVNEFFESRNK